MVDPVKKRSPVHAGLEFPGRSGAGKIDPALRLALSELQVKLVRSGTPEEFDPNLPQGGGYAVPAYSADRMRS